LVMYQVLLSAANKPIVISQVSSLAVVRFDSHHQN
jgi:hypothetical protein